MSLRPDGTYRCDRSGRELENGGVHEAAILTTLDEDGGVVVFHFCHEDGCSKKVASTRNLADYIESRSTP